MAIPQEKCLAEAHLRPVHPLLYKAPTSTIIQQLSVYLAHIYIDQQLKNTTGGKQKLILCERTLNLPHTV